MCDSVDLLLNGKTFMRVDLEGYEEECAIAETDYCDEIFKNVVIKNSGIPREFIIFPDDLLLVGEDVWPL